MTERTRQLRDWLTATLGRAPDALRPASSDASFRRYFRFDHDGGTLIAMDAPPEREPCDTFVRIARLFAGFGLHVPEVLAEDHEHGFLLLSDLGDTPYLDMLDEYSVERLYGDALGALVTLQVSRPGNDGLPAYDERLLRAELALFSEWYLSRHRGLKDAEASLAPVYELLVANALEQPRVCVHRDYHSRNLMVVDANNPGILDFQDAVMGPVTYDLVSLLRDCYIAWPRERVEEWALGYFELAIQSGILRERQVDERQFLRWFDLMGVQRHLKAAGIFARLNYRDAKPGYLDDIPRTLGYVRDVAGRYPELAPLLPFVYDE